MAAPQCLIDLFSSMTTISSQASCPALCASDQDTWDFLSPTLLSSSWLQQSIFLLKNHFPAGQQAVLVGSAHHGGHLGKVRMSLVRQTRAGAEDHVHLELLSEVAESEDSRVGRPRRVPGDLIWVPYQIRTKSRAPPHWTSSYRNKFFICLV
jgi:hypothetical protein